MWNKSVYVELRDFGKNMQNVAIFMLISLIPAIGPIALILYLVFMFNALKNIKLINYSLNDQALELYRSKMVSSITRGFLSLFSLIPGGIFIAVGLLLPFQRIYITILIGALLLLIGFILMISSFATERNAWKNLNLFLKENEKMLPSLILRDTVEGVDNLETSALLYSLFMFGITIIIGFIFRIIGYFKLSKLSQITIPTPVEQVVKVVNSNSSSSSVLMAQENSEIVNFCPMCGAKASEYGMYCAECGSKIK
jgi:uncharacterized membrane protein